MALARRRCPILRLDGRVQMPEFRQSRGSQIVDHIEERDLRRQRIRVEVGIGG